MRRDEDVDPPAHDTRLLTRRRVLQSAGMVIASTAFPPGGEAATPAAVQAAPASGGPLVGEVMTTLSAYMSAAGDRALPDNVTEQAKWHILDTFASMVSGSELPAGRAAAKFARTFGGGQVATVAGDTVLCGAIDAALANGTLAHADETDDSWPGGGHPGCCVVSAALAAGEQFGISGTRFLRAVTLGYDLVARALTTLRPGMEVGLKDSHAVGGIFGSAAAAGCAASLSADQTRWMLDYTAQQCSGLRSWYRDTDHIEKGFVFGGMPARSGVTSALLVQVGWNGVEDILSGRDNFLLAFAPKTDPTLMIHQLGERYEVVGTNIKRWTVATPIQEPLDALEAILKRQPIDPAQVQQVLVRSAPGSVVDDSDPPDINMQFSVALMLIDKTVTFRSVHSKARMQDPAILRLRAKVKLEAPAGGEGQGAGRGARLPLIEITLANGTKVTQEGGPVLGTIRNRMTEAQVIAKCRDLMDPVLGAAKCTRLIESVMALKKMKDVRELRPSLQRTYSASPPRLSNYPTR